MPSLAWVCLELRDDDMVMLTIRDNGRGISEADMNKPKSFGLRGIRERARLFGGKAIIHSAPHAGTRISVELPLTSKTSAATVGDSSRDGSAPP